MRGLLAIGVVAVCAHTARAEVATDTTREVHGIAIGAGGAVYLGVEFLAKSHLAPEHCRICEPPAVDAAVSDALRWDGTFAANLASTVIGYAAAPIYAIALTASESGDWRRRYDDAVPILEASIAVGLLHHVVKFTVGRQRPFVHHAAPGSREPDDDDNASLFSGHTGLAFACATAGGVVAHERHYADAPWVFAGGYAIALATGYLRIAADKHWFTDVLIGAAVGVGLGFAIPLGLHGDTLKSPTREAATVAATPRDTPHIFAFSIPI